MNASADFDPIVAAVLARIEPSVAIEADEILRRARAATPGARRGMRRRAFMLAAAAALVLAGAALAAHRLGLLPWLEADEPGTAHFVIDTKHRFTGPVPDVVYCPSLKGPEFSCKAAPVGHDSHQYNIPLRVGRPRFTTRAAVLALAVGYERHHQPSLARRLRSQARAVPSEFFRRYAVLATLQAWAVVYDLPGPNGQSVLVVPPKEVPTWIVCSKRQSEELRCRDLAGSGAVPLGAAVYSAFPGFKNGRINSSWPRARRGPRADYVPRALAEHIWGRKLRPAEVRLISTLHGIGWHYGPEVH
jgi:hypothetical protein